MESKETMAFEYKIGFKLGDKRQILNEIYEKLQGLPQFGVVETSVDCIDIVNDKGSEKWSVLAEISIEEYGFFVTTILKRDDRNALFEVVSDVLKKYNIVSEIIE